MQLPVFYIIAVQAEQCLLLITRAHLSKNFAVSPSYSPNLPNIRAGVGFSRGFRMAACLQGPLFIM